jgi:hypothetical protein
VILRDASLRDAPQDEVDDWFSAATCLVLRRPRSSRGRLEGREGVLFPENALKSKDWDIPG